MALHFSILCPQEEIAQGEARQVVAPGTDGNFGVLENHAPFASLLRPGCLMVEGLDGNKTHYYVRGGFVRASADEIVILADDITRREDLNETSIREGIHNAKDDVMHLKDEEKIKEAKRSLKQYEAQLAVIDLK